METFIVLSEFFGGIILFLGLGYLLGYFLRLDKYYEKDQKNSECVQKNKFKRL